MSLLAPILSLRDRRDLSPDDRTLRDGASLRRNAGEPIADHFVRDDGSDRYRTLLGTASRTSRPGSSLQIQGTPGFVAQTERALDVLRSTAPGRAMLEEIDRSGRRVVIRMSTERDGSAVGRNEDDGYLRPDGTRGPGTDVTVFWDPTYAGPDEPGGETFPPYTVLAHELVHAFNMVTGTMADSERGPVPAEENQAVGLPFDHDDNPSTPDITPEEFYRQLGLPNVSENAIRAALGLPLKTEY
jgi:hypothetical protein